MHFYYTKSQQHLLLVLDSRGVLAEPAMLCTCILCRVCCTSVLFILQEGNFLLNNIYWNATESCILQLASLKNVTITTLQTTKTANSMEEPPTSNYVSVYHRLQISVLTHSHQKPLSPLTIAMSLNAVSAFVVMLCM